MKKIACPSLVKFVLTIALFFSAWFIVTSSAQAQILPPPITHGATVSATMPDIVPPTAPVLISPENGELLSTNRPQFVWLESTDNVEMSHYQFYLNGELVLDNLATVGSFSQYSLSYNSELGYYYLDVKFDIPQGDNTWKIVAVDAVGLTTSSATWSFVIDSIAPSFVIIKIGEVDTSISAQDTNTVPDNPIQLSANEPKLIAKGEANSLVQLTIKIPGEDDINKEIWIDSQGNWSYTLPILPRDTIITLNFVIIDQARHISVIDGVKIIIPSAVIIIPPVGEASPTPTLKPGEPTVTPGGPTTPPEPSVKPPIEIPYTPPKEIVHEIVRWLTPTPIWKIASRPWFSKLMDFFGPWLALIVASWPIIISTLLLVRRVGSAGLLSLKQLWKIWIALGLIPWKEREGWVFDQDYFSLEGVEDILGVPFATVTAISQSEPNGFPPYYEQLVTDRFGLYSHTNLPAKVYKVAITHPDYRYPSKSERGQGVIAENFYKAEEMEVSLENDNLSLIIPADNDLISETRIPANIRRKDRYSKIAWSFLTRFQVWLNKVALYRNWGALINTLLLICVVVFWPTNLNKILIILYILYGLTLVLWSKIFTNVRGLVIDERGQSVQDALVRLTSIEIKNDGDSKEIDNIIENNLKKEKVFVALTDKNGRFNFSMKKGQFIIEATKPNYSRKQTLQKEDVVQIERYLDQHNLVLGIVSK